MRVVAATKICGPGGVTALPGVTVDLPEHVVQALLAHGAVIVPAVLTAPQEAPKRKEKGDG
jgi:hypothetical protein